MNTSNSGFWKIAADGTFVSCLYNDLTCSGTGFGDASCIDDFSGYFCGECPNDKYFDWLQISCRKFDNLSVVIDWAIAGFVGLLLPVMIVIYFGILLKKFRKFNHNEVVSSEIQQHQLFNIVPKIVRYNAQLHGFFCSFQYAITLIEFIQIISVLKWLLLVDSSSNLDIFSHYLGIFSHASIWRSLLSSFSWMSWDYLTICQFSFVFPLAVMSLTYLLYRRSYSNIVVDNLEYQIFQRLSNFRFLVAVTFFFVLSLPGVIQMLVGSISCQNVDPNHSVFPSNVFVLRNDVSVSCNSTMYSINLMGVIAGLIVFGIVWQAIVLYLLSSSRKEWTFSSFHFRTSLLFLKDNQMLDDGRRTPAIRDIIYHSLQELSSFSQDMRYFFQPFKNYYWWWWVVPLMKRIAIIGVLQILEFDLRVLGLVGIIVISVVLTMIVRPFQEISHHRCSVLADLITLFIILCLLSSPSSVTLKWVPQLIFPYGNIYAMMVATALFVLSCMAWILYSIAFNRKVLLWTRRILEPEIFSYLQMEIQPAFIEAAASGLGALPSSIKVASAPLAFGIDMHDLQAGGKVAVENRGTILESPYQEDKVSHHAWNGVFRGLATGISPLPSPAATLPREQQYMAVSFLGDRHPVNISKSSSVDPADGQAITAVAHVASAGPANEALPNTPPPSFWTCVFSPVQDLATPQSASSCDPHSHPQQWENVQSTNIENSNCSVNSGNSNSCNNGSCENHDNGAAAIIVIHSPILSAIDNDDKIDNINDDNTDRHF